MITGSVSGKDINGTPSEEITVKCRKTGNTGKKTGIGRKTIIGAFRKYNITRTRADNSNKMIEGNTIETIEMTGTTETIEMIETIETTGMTSTTSMTRTINTARMASTRVDPCEAKAVRITEL
jgi:hypothetical protein